MKYLYFGIFPAFNNPEFITVQVSFRNDDTIICIPFEAMSAIACENGWLVITKPDGKQITFKKE